MAKHAERGGKKKKPKNIGVGIDFKKAKHKVGKKLPQAQNSTDTNFKAKAISLPGQHVGEEKGAAVSERNLTLKELLAQSGHYSHKVRKDALHGLSQLLQTHPEELRQHTGPVLEKLADRVTDADKDVRAALMQLLSQRVLPGLAGGLLTPFLPLLMAHVCSAMTHLDSSIRSGALGFLEALLVAAPVQLTTQFLEPALQHYSSLLLPSTRARSVSSRSMPMLLQVLSSLQTFLSTAEAAAGSSAAVAGPADMGDVLQRAGQHSVALLSHRCDWLPASTLSQATQSLAKLADGGSLRPEAVASGGLHAELLSRLLDAWMECAACTVGETADATAVSAMEACLQCMRRVMQQASSNQDEGKKLRSAVLSKVGRQFPMRGPAVQCVPAMQQALVRLNLASMQLLTSFLEGPMQGSQEAGWRAQLLDFYTAMLERGEALPREGLFADDLQQPPLPAQAYTTLLAGVEKVLPLVPAARGAQLLGGFAALCSRTPSKSPVKLACLRFMAGIFAQPAKFLRPGAHGEVPVPEAEAAQWLQALPKLLWELGSSRPEASRLALRTLVDAARFARCYGPIHASCKQLQPSLAVFYCALLPAAAGASSGRLLSPLAKLPVHCQVLAVDLFYYLPALDDALWTSAGLMCHMPAFSAATASRIIAVLAVRATSESQQSRFADFLMSLLDGGPLSESLSDERHAEVASFAAQAMAAAATGDPEVLHRLEDHLLAACVAATGSRAWLGLLLAVAAVAALASVPTHGNSRQAGAAGPDSPSGQPGSMPPQLLSALPEVVCRAVISLSSSDGQSDAGDRLQRGMSAIIDLLQLLPSVLAPLIDVLPSAAGGYFSAASKAQKTFLESELATAERLKAAADFLLTLCGTSRLLPQLADVVSELQEAAHCLRMMVSNIQLMSTGQQIRAAETACNKLISIVDTFSGAHD